ncbi:hypothetical protein SB784_37850, partial [Burkholderia sp. SIMBA_048]
NAWIARRGEARDSVAMRWLAYRRHRIDLRPDLGASPLPRAGTANASREYLDRFALHCHAYNNKRDRSISPAGLKTR